MISGRTDLFTWVVSGVALAALATDVLKGKIFNWLTLPSLAVGLIVGFVVGGFAGGIDSCVGALLGLLLFGWMFRIGVMGGGDVKLLMALGAWGGSVFVFETAIVSIVVGGVLALGFLIGRRRLADFLARVKSFFIAAALRDSGNQPFELDRGNTMPFGIAIALAAIWVAVDSPFGRFGDWPWR